MRASIFRFFNGDPEIKNKAAVLLKTNSELVWSLTYVYFVYVVLGGIHHGLHKHIYTGDENESVFKRLLKGKPVTFREDVYDEFFSFKHYFTTYKLHVLTAGAWLLSGVYNLRNPPEFVGRNPSGKALFEGWWHQRGSGYTYVISSFLKGVTASIVSLRSRSLGFARYPMFLCGIYDLVSLMFALERVLSGDVSGHKKWMIR